MKFFSPRTTARVLALACPVIAGQALAHVTLETQQAPVGSYYKAVLRVPHGCAGSDTLKLRVRIPDGVISVKPQPKPGWSLDIAKADYPTAHVVHGAQVKSGVRELVWSGRLPDAYYDEFVFQAYLTTDLVAGKVLAFPTVQECEKGVSRWIDTPSMGKEAKMPAPTLMLLPSGK